MESLSFHVKLSHYFVCLPHCYLNHCALQCRRQFTLRMKSWANIVLVLVWRTEGYFWNAIWKKRWVKKCICLHDTCPMYWNDRLPHIRHQLHESQHSPGHCNRKFTFWLDPFHSLIWKHLQPAVSMGLLERTSRLVSPSAGVKTSRSQWGVSYRLDCIYLGEWVNILHSVNFHCAFHWSYLHSLIFLSRKKVIVTHLLFYCYDHVCQVN